MKTFPDAWWNLDTHMGDSYTLDDENAAKVEASMVNRERWAEFMDIYGDRAYVAVDGICSLSEDSVKSRTARAEFEKHSEPPPWLD